MLSAENQRNQGTGESAASGTQLRAVGMGQLWVMEIISENRATARNIVYCCNIPAFCVLGGREGMSQSPCNPTTISTMCLLNKYTLC